MTICASLLAGHPGWQTARQKKEKEGKRREEGRKRGKTDIWIDWPAGVKPEKIMQRGRSPRRCKKAGGMTLVTEHHRAGRSAAAPPGPGAEHERGEHRLTRAHVGKRVAALFDQAEQPEDQTARAP